MKLKFDSSLEYQLEAIAAVTDLFEGMPSRQGDFEISFAAQEGQLEGTTELGVGNRRLIDTEPLLNNLQAVQKRNNVPISASLADYKAAYDFFNFSVEMETGTGKTYIYLRTIFELNKLYGFKKFIIVVPSVAIREGVISSIDLMRDHFRGIYNSVPFDRFVYNSKDLSKVRQFATSDQIQIMIINIQAFQKDAGDETDYTSLTEEQRKRLNVIHQEQDRMSGRRPIEYVQAVRPIVIIDEPQSVDNTAKSQRAVKTLQPLFCLRYSATHVNPYHLLYKLDPIKAYDMRLVKQIEVAAIRSETDFNQAFIRLEKIGYENGAKTPHARATIYDDKPSGSAEKKIILKQGTDISQQTRHAGYDGYIVTNICAEEGLEHVEFANGRMLRPGQEEGGNAGDVLKAQIRQSVEEHFKKELRFKDKGIKVLSLFFIDRVANYRWYDDAGSMRKGKLAEWFEEAYREISAKPMYRGLLPYNAEDVHDGYFSADKKKGKVILKDTAGNTQADEETYNLIMRDKERLLSLNVPLRFIFSHSALREGWDNPNVFQICSLREMGTDRERRQTLGRGLRLPVNQDGERVFDENINRLTVIAGESFEEYARGLQADIERDCNIKFGRIEKIAFAQMESADGTAIGQTASGNIWAVLQAAGYIDEHGDIQDKFDPKREGFRLELPEELLPMRAEITDVMKKYIFENRIVDARKKHTLQYRKRVELNEDFKVLWNKISRKTRYTVEFRTDELVARAVEKIESMEQIRPVRLMIEKTGVEITQPGVEAGRVAESKVENIQGPAVLPDILAFLQRETELTRGTLAQILKECGRIGEFKVNPQAFMTETARLINRALHEMVVAGIKYVPVADQYYEMHLFEQEEMERYLTQLYKVQRQEVDDPAAEGGRLVRTPYDYVLFQSELEKEIAEKLDNHERVKFFCKLPSWFLVPSPLGDYNPDWAVVLEDSGKLYLVRESKSTHKRDQRRDTENSKVDCGQAHFKALDVNFKVATNIFEVLAE
ncbi:MAG: DEAD/DEAH box helicase family protein [bacterium]|nr:DEAD/DEAH box helicase family protein [bacterium]